MPTISLWDYLRASAHSLDAQNWLSSVLTAHLRADLERIIFMPDDLAGQLDEEFIQSYAGLPCYCSQSFDPENTPVAVAATALETYNNGGVVILRSSLLPKLLNVHVSDEHLRVVSGESTGMETIISWLTTNGYERQYQVESPGEWSRRGGVLDIWPMGKKKPVRLDYWGDELERIRYFDTVSQLSYATATEVSIPSLVESNTSIAFGEWCEALGYAVVEAAACMQELTPQLTSPAFTEHFQEDELYEKAQFVGKALEKHRTWLENGTSLASLQEQSVAKLAAAGRACHKFVLPAALRGSQRFPLEPRFLELKRQLAGGVSIWLSAASPRHVKGLRQLAEPYGLRIVQVESLPAVLPAVLREEGLEDQGAVLEERPAIFVFTGPALPTLLLDSGLLLLDEGTLIRGTGFVARKVVRSSKKPQIATDDLGPGDICVHEEYGVCRFDGLLMRTFEGNTQEFLKLVFDKGGAVLLPVDRIAMLEKLASGDADTVLDTLGSGRFLTRKKKAREDALRYANEMLAQDARRKTGTAPALPPPATLSTAIGLSFPFVLTPDQEKAIEQIYDDMALGVPMDRLLVGDVGFGKTEVALRAAAYAVEHGHQVVVLAPTTILTYQHARQFVERIGTLGSRVAYVNRFRSDKENAETMRAMSKGEIDILIGTHRVLQRDFHAPRLGLVVIDEEHKFGIQQKEKIQGLGTQAHRLSMSATPIPRSLNLSLSGQRGISTIVTPPPSRQEVETSVIPLDQKICAAVIQRELDRDGQVFVVAPHIRDLEGIAQLVAEWVPDARVGIGHGQLSGEKMEHLFLDFWEKRIDILVSTSIIESGIDVANANTILIWNGHHYGLADLYQLRGRVGRAERKGYCQILVPLAQKLTEKAKKRLEVIERFTRLGSGYQVALYDLEIRGAGELLGKKQSGHVQSIGMGLYARMLEEAIAEVRQQPLLHLPEPEIRTWFPASLPVDCGLSDAERLDVYRSLFVVASRTDFEDRKQTIADRFYLDDAILTPMGYSAMTRGYARSIGATQIEWRVKEVRIALHSESPLDRAALIQHSQELGLRMTPQAMILNMPDTVDLQQDASLIQMTRENLAAHLDEDQINQFVLQEKQWDLLQPVLAQLARMVRQD